ncbi:unnamed protein product [Rotaria magnacalcarata]|uniref:Uncharacterized protein n=1 Tax=Rotaria magnacalcarata TaxID=392030 RepID=A0A820JMS2_9BILA|nr:unnamed protein product [Rotaria magnacalcarata]CAF2105187.1 unnamed protein product [Rotaria magnacalcarata]CAF4330141.1 unnamed protein product [Rotaria magnacalcarata]CAF4525141.1 unnamed protein product [Rotaria magnacalcarata]
MQQEHISKLDTNLRASSFDEEHVETLLKLCDEIRPNLILTTGGTRISLYDITPEVCVLVLLLFNRLISALGDELSYYKENLWPNTDNGCEVIGNYSHGYAFEVKFLMSFLSRPVVVVVYNVNSGRSDGGGENVNSNSFNSD